MSKGWIAVDHRGDRSNGSLGARSIFIGSGPETVLAVGHGFGRRLFLMVGGSIAIACGATAIALTIAVVTFVRRRRARRRAVEPRPVPVAP